MNDPYRTLGIASNASEDEVKKAYRTMAKKYHPDVNKDPGAEERFIEIQNAYQQIMDAKKRGDSGNFWENSGFGGFGGNTYSGAGQGNAYQNVVNYLNMQRYSEAYQILQQMQDRGADWYYLSAMANYGMGNQIAAMDCAEKACQMDPTNQQYRQLYAQLQSGRTRYQNMQQPFTMGGSNLCCKLIVCNMCLTSCCGRGYICC
ncbi:MAG: J domain-containing protein [Longicatena sp.]